MDISEIRRLSDKDLEARCVTPKQELWKIRFDLATRQEKQLQQAAGDPQADRPHPDRDDRAPARRRDAAADAEKAS